MKKNILIDNIEVFVFDFDGVLTDNQVYVDSNGNESVCCNRSDGLAFDVLRRLNKKSFILSTEKNKVVSERAKKLKIKAIQGVDSKVDALKDLAIKYDFDINNILYVGNDLNDFRVMKLCGNTACPSDSHSEIKKISDLVLDSPGGKGVVRELLEKKLCVDFLQFF